jgi:hypothetical protein
MTEKKVFQHVNAVQCRLKQVNVQKAKYMLVAQRVETGCNKRQMDETFILTTAELNKEMYSGQDSVRLPDHIHLGAITVTMCPLYFIVGLPTYVVQTQN